MRQKKRKDKRFNWDAFSRLAVFTVLLTGGFAARSMAKQPGQKTFSSPDEAANALVTAMKNNDEKLMLEILGPDGKHIVYSGDEVEDAQNQANFVER